MHYAKQQAKRRKKKETIEVNGRGIGGYSLSFASWLLKAKGGRLLFSLVRSGG